MPNENVVGGFKSKFQTGDVVSDPVGALTVIKSIRAGDGWFICDDDCCRNPEHLQLLYRALPEALAAFHEADVERRVVWGKGDWAYDPNGSVNGDSALLCFGVEGMSRKELNRHLSNHTLHPLTAKRWIEKAKAEYGPAEPDADSDPREEELGALAFEHEKQMLRLKREEQEHRTAAAKAKRERQELILKLTQNQAETLGIPQLRWRRFVRNELSFSGEVKRGDGYRCDDEEPHGQILIGGVDVIGALPEGTLPSALVVLRVCGEEIQRHEGDGSLEHGFGYSSWPPTDRDTWTIGGEDVIERILNHEGQQVELCVSWESIEAAQPKPLPPLETIAQDFVDELANATPEYVAQTATPAVTYDPVRKRINIGVGNQPITVVLTCEKSNRGTQFGFALPNEASETWAKQNAPALRECLASFTNRYGWRPLVEDDQKSSNPIAVTVKEMFADLRGMLLAAFPEAGLVIEEQTS